MNNPLSSLSLLGLDPSSFRLVHDDELSGDGGEQRHSDGETCSCRWECVEHCEDPAQHLVDAAA